MTVATFAKKETIHLIDGPVGKLEVVVSEPLKEPIGALGIVCHPHPLYGGTMDNKVVTTLVKMFQHLGLYAVRFNFRGVGRSEGAFDYGDGELDDLVTVIQWMQQQQVNQEIWLAGFSFGAYVAARAATELPINRLVTVAPAVQRFPMHRLSEIHCPWVLVQGEKDDVIPPDEVFKWAESRDPKPIIIRFPEAGHFFHGQLGELRTRLEEALKRL